MLKAYALIIYYQSILFCLQIIINYPKLTADLMDFDADLRAVPELTSPGEVRGKPGEERGSDQTKPRVTMPGDVNQSVDRREVGGAVTKLQASIVGCHRETVRRVTAVENCPSSNLHHFVQQVPHSRHEYSPPTDSHRSKVKGGKLTIYTGILLV